MMKLFRRFLILLISFVFVLSSMIGCSSSMKGCSSSNENGNDNIFTINEETKKGQVHVYNFSETNDYLIRNGNTEYQIVFPDSEASFNLTFAVKEFQSLFNEATGIDLKSGTDKNVVFNENQKIISIGDTSILVQAGVTVDKGELGSDGFIIKSVGQSVFIAGGSYGTVYGVYKFFNVLFGFEVFTADEYSIQKDVKEKKFVNFDIKDIPDISKVSNPYMGSASSNYRLGLKQIGDVFISNGANKLSSMSYIYHNILRGILPYVVYGIDVNADNDAYGFPITSEMKQQILEHPMYESHPEWFNHPEWYVFESNMTDNPHGDPNYIDPCNVNFTIDEEDFTEQQNQASQQALYDVLFYEIEQAYLIGRNYSDWMVFSCEDNAVTSTDKTSLENFNKYGTHAAEYIQCANLLARRMKEKYPNFRMFLFAYVITIDAPVKLNSKGEYEPIDDSVILEDNVSVIQCYGDLRRHYAMDDPKNADVLEIEKKWDAIANQRATWLYSMTYYTNNFLPKACINGLSETYRYLFSKGYVYVFDEAQLYSGGIGTDWVQLKIYLTSKLRWNVYENTDELTDKFFKAYFKDAAEPMREYYDMQQTHLAYLNTKIEDLSSFSGEVALVMPQFKSEESWPDNFLQQLLEKIDKAYAAINSYKETDPVLYSKLYDRIKMESLTTRFLRADIYGSYYGDLKAQWMSEIYYDAIGLGLKYFTASGGTLEAYFGTYK